MDLSVLVGSNTTCLGYTLSHVGVESELGVYEDVKVCVGGDYLKVPIQRVWPHIGMVITLQVQMDKGVSNNDSPVLDPPGYGE